MEGESIYETGGFDLPKPEGGEHGGKWSRMYPTMAVEAGNGVGKN